MQNRGAILFFTILLTLACIYQLSFTWVANGIEKDAREYANGDSQLEKQYLDSMRSEVVYDLLLVDFTYSDVKENEIHLGLDLQGGMNVVLEVSVEELLRNLANNSTDPGFVQAIERAKELRTESQEDFITLFGRAFNEVAPGARLASPSIFGTRDLAGQINPATTTNQEVLNFLRIEAEDAIERSFNILRSRVDKFGVSSPNIQRLGNSGRILVELPGVSDPERVRKLLQGAAKLEFWETFNNEEVYGSLAKANEVLAQIRKGEEASDEPVDTTVTIENADTLAIQEPDSTVTDTTEELSLAEKLATRDTSGAPTDSLALMQQQLKDNPLFAVLMPAGDQQNGLYPGPVIGFAQSKDTAEVREILNMRRIASVMPNKIKYVWSAKPTVENGTVYQLIALRVTKRDGTAPIEGDVVVDARKELGQFTNAPEISMTMNGDGAQKWKTLTREASQEPSRAIAIVLDDVAYSWPVPSGEIAGGRSSITGNFTDEEAEDLATTLKVGKMPAPARIVQEAVVGPSLGKEAINAGLISFLIAFAIVLLFMAFWYNQAGWVANIALVANLFFIIGVLASLQAVLTLPGIAGIVLIIGMTVDANVLIFERIREELRAGKGLRLALEDGYKNAYSSIIDANVTSLLTGIILYVFGTGPIRGFATTLVIGILTSLFASIFITRLVFSWRLNKNKAISFANKSTENVFKNTNFDFVGKRKIFYLISGLIITAGIVSFFVRGFSLGVDFKGGRSYVVRFDERVNSVDLSKTLAGVFNTAPEVKTFGDNNQVKITTNYRIDDESATVDNEVESTLVEGLGTYNEAGSFEIMQMEKVGPTIADDIKTAAVWAVLFSLLVIFLYMVLRFRRWQFGLGALTALFHDVLIVLSIFSMFWGLLPFSLEIDQAFIAAILTVVGYSINDTVVVFDRIREFLGQTQHKHQEAKSLINEALNSTISRTVNTSMTTIMVLLPIFIFGGETIRGFSFALLIGVIVGTYSSLCIATPVVVDFLKPKKTTTTK